MAPRTQEEIAERLRQKFAPRLSEAFAKEDRADILAALSEAADAARQEEREALRELAQVAAEADVSSIRWNDLIGWLDAREKGQP